MLARYQVGEGKSWQRILAATFNATPVANGVGDAVHITQVELDRALPITGEMAALLLLQGDRVEDSGFFLEWVSHPVYPGIRKVLSLAVHPDSNSLDFGGYNKLYGPQMGEDILRIMYLWDRTYHDVLLQMKKLSHDALFHGGDRTRIHPQIDEEIERLRRLEKSQLVRGR